MFCFGSKLAFMKRKINQGEKTLMSMKVIENSDNNHKILEQPTQYYLKTQCFKRKERNDK